MTQRLTPTQVLSAFQANSEELDLDAIAKAAHLLQEGKLVAFPTETVYGLGANALSAEAVARIFEAKGRPARNPVIVHVPDATAAKALSTEWPEAADRLAAAFWPGPLTLVLPKSDLIPEIVTAGGATVGLRVPAHPVALALLHAAGIPVAAPSANRSMQLSPTTAQHVLQSLNGRIDLILDGGPTTGGIESTVLSLAGERPRLLRPGLITPAQIETLIGPIKRPETPTQADPRSIQESKIKNQKSKIETDALPSPGMLARHYAPRAPLEITAEGKSRVRQLLEAGEHVGWLTTSSPHSDLSQVPALVLMTMPQDPESYAVRLYAALHTLDAAGVTRIVVDALPLTDAWMALRDRLQRASTPVEGPEE